MSDTIDNDARTERNKRRFSVGNVFSPATPINAKDLFAGRLKQVGAIIDAISQRGQHVILYGERGVGKTSLANVLSGFLETAAASIVAPHINCDSSDTYSSLWRKVFSRVHAVQQKRQVGINGQSSTQITPLIESLPETITPDIVRSALENLGSQGPLIVIVDEFDRLPPEIAKVFADTIKTLSDFAVPATLVLVGVADSVNDLIREHQSIERALVQIQMPRMLDSEVRELMDKCLGKIGMGIEPDALKMICFLSKGLPHYAHLLGLYSAWECIDKDANTITFEHLERAIRVALEKSQQSTQQLYHTATKSPHKDNIYSQVLLACALADVDSLGYFAAADVRTPLRERTGKQYEIPAFARHLHDFCEPGRGPVLQKSGAKYSTRFRFLDPLLQPYVILKGQATGNILAKEKPGQPEPNQSSGENRHNEERT